MHALAVDRRESVPRSAGPQVVVLVRTIDVASLRAIAYARSIASHLTVLQLPGGDDPLRVRRKLRQLDVGGCMAFVVLSGPRDPIDQVATALDAIEADDPGRPVALVLPEIVPRRAWLFPLHDQTASRLKFRLLRRPNTVVIDVPYHV